jgi:hypothetical protein
MTQTQQTIKHSWGGLCNLTSSLIWAKYGYWSKGHEPPEWFDEELKLAEIAANIVQPSDVRYEVIFNSVIPGEVTGTFRCWDAANPWVEPWEVGFRFKNKESVEANYKQEYGKHKQLHDGVINALLHYKETGEPIEPDWLPQSNTNFHWLKKGYKPENYKGFRQLLREDLTASP